MARKSSPPKYRRQAGKAGDRAFVELGGVRRYLGPFGTRESREAYGRLIVECQASGGHLPAPRDEITVTELAARYWTHAEHYYVKDGEPTSELGWIKMALKPLLTLYGSVPAMDLTPLKLKAVREQFIKAGKTRKAINARIDRIKRMYRWATENEIIPAGVYDALRAVAGLREGRSDAKESRPVSVVCQAHVEAVRPHVPATVRAMIDLQLASGMRPGEVRLMRGVELNTTNSIWEYRPASHKTAHHGHQRVIALGPRAQEIIAPFLKGDPNAYLFSPLDVPGCRCVNGAYPKDAYARAIARGCKEAGVPHWAPNQLRHSSATRIRKESGLEGAQIWLGHKHARTSEIYAETNQDLARQLAAKYG